MRAHRDPALQRIQHISRMSPRILRDDNGTIKTEFERLMIDNITFVDSWTHSSIGNNVQRMYSKRRPASQAATEYTMGCLRRLVESGDEHLVSTAVDLQRPDGSRADFLTASDPDLLKTINTKSKEPKTLVFWRYATYEATVNGESYSQSQLLLMIEIPTLEQVTSKSPIFLMAAPNGTNQFELGDNMPTEEELLERNWTKVSIGVPEERYFTKGRNVGCRRQYSMKHQGSATINKLMVSKWSVPVNCGSINNLLISFKGNTLLCPSATEVTQILLSITP